MIICFAGIILVMGAHPAVGQTLYGFGFLGGQTTFAVFTIDPVTGAFTPVVPFVPTGSGVANNSVALDPVGRRLFFVTPDGTLNTVNLTTGVTTQATMPNCCAFLQFDAGRGILYGFGFLAGQTTFSVFTIDPATGAFTAVVPFVPVGSGVASNSVALDPVGQRLFFTSPDGILNTVNLTTGVTTQATMPNCCAFLQFDAGRGILYGFGFLAGQTTFSVFTIDPATGAFTAVVPFVPVGSGVASNSVALDPAGQRLFFMSPDGILNTVNLTTGVTTQATMPNCCAFLLVSAQTSANIPLLGPTALLCLLVALSLVGQHVLQRHHKNGVSET